MKTTIKLCGHPWKGVIKFDHGDKGSILWMESLEGEPIADFSKTVYSLASDEIAIKDYSENEGCYEQLVQKKVVQPAHRIHRQGYVNFQVCRLHPDFIKNK